MSHLKSTVSEYIKIRRYVMNLILQAGGTARPLPSIQELSDLFGVSRPTVCKALKELTAEGFILAKRGLGSFTNPTKTPPHANFKQVPVIGILHGDGMNVHYDYYVTCILGEIQKAVAYTPAIVHLITLNSWEPDAIYRELKNEQLDALVCYTPADAVIPALERLRNEGLSILFGETFHPAFDSILLGYEDSAYECGKQLIADGRRNPVFCLDTGTWMRQSAGLKRAYREAGLPLNENFFFKDLRTLREDLEKLIRYQAPVDAVYSSFLWNNEISELLLQIDPEIYRRCCLVENDYAKVPEKPFPRITFKTPFETFARELANQLNRRIRNPQAEPVRMTVPLEIKKCF